MVTNWLSDCGLKLNPAKTKFMLISRKRFPPNLSVCIEGTPIIQGESLKYLGVTITSDLSWSTHINSTCTKARKQLGFLYQNFYQANRQSIAYLYKATVLPLLDYCCCVWDPHQSTYTAKLEKVQKFAAKLSGQKTTIIFSHFSTGHSWQLDDSNKSYCYVEEFWLVIQLSPHLFLHPTRLQIFATPTTFLCTDHKLVPRRTLGHTFLVLFPCGTLYHLPSYLPALNCFVPQPQLLVYSHNPTCVSFLSPIVLPFCDSVLNYLHTFTLEEVQPIILATSAIFGCNLPVLVQQT